MLIGSKHCTLLILSLIVMFATSCGKPEHSIDAESSPKEVKVEVEKLQKDKYNKPIMFSGIIKPHQKSLLSSKVSGQIVDIKVEEGQAVKYGQPLLMIDDRDAKIQMAKLEAESYSLDARQQELNDMLIQLKSQVQMLFHDQEKFIAQAELAQTSFDRMTKLYNKEVISQQEYDESKTQNEVAKAQLLKSQAEYDLLMAKKGQIESKHKQLLASIEQNKANIANAVVYHSYFTSIAPLNGIVSKKHIDIGEMAQPGSPLLTVENPDNLYIELNVEESKAFLFKVGMKVNIVIDAYLGNLVPGVVREIVPVADPQTHTFIVKVDLPDHKAIHSGMSTKVAVPIAGNSIFVPRTAISKSGQIVGVFVVDNTNVARYKIINVGQEIDGFVEVISGLKEKDNIIISNLDSIADGTKVKVLGDN